MKDVFIIYESKYGHSKKYALALSEALKCEISEKKKIDKNKLLNSETIVFLGGLYAGKLNGFDIITKNFDKLKNKNIIVVPVGLLNPDNPENLEHTKESVCKKLSPEIKEKLTFFSLKGGIDYSKLGFKDKMMMSFMYKALAKRGVENLNEDGKLVIDTYGKKYDAFHPESLNKIIDYINEKD